MGIFPVRYKATQLAIRRCILQRRRNIGSARSRQLSELGEARQTAPFFVAQHARGQRMCTYITEDGQAGLVSAELEEAKGNIYLCMQKCYSMAFIALAPLYRVFSSIF